MTSSTPEIGPRTAGVAYPAFSLCTWAMQSPGGFGAQFDHQPHGMQGFKKQLFWKQSREEMLQKKQGLGEGAVGPRPKCQIHFLKDPLSDQFLQCSPALIVHIVSTECCPSICCLRRLPHSASWQAVPAIRQPQKLPPRI